MSHKYEKREQALHQVLHLVSGVFLIIIAAGTAFVIGSYFFVGPWRWFHTQASLIAIGCMAVIRWVAEIACKYDNKMIQLKAAYAQGRRGKRTVKIESIQ